MPKFYLPLKIPPCGGILREPANQLDWYFKLKFFNLTIANLVYNRFYHNIMSMRICQLGQNRTKDININLIMVAVSKTPWDLQKQTKDQVPICQNLKH